MESPLERAVRHNEEHMGNLCKDLTPLQRLIAAVMFAAAIENSRELWNGLAQDAIFGKP